jgi:hypothetical protein
MSIVTPPSPPVFACTGSESNPRGDPNSGVNQSWNRLSALPALSNLENDLAARMSDFARFVRIAGTFQRKRAADCWPEAAFVGESVQVGKVAALGTDHEKLRLLHLAKQSRDRLHRKPKENTW